MIIAVAFAFLMTSQNPAEEVSLSQMIETGAVLQELEAYIVQHPETVNTPNPQSRIQPLMVAARMGRIDVLEMLRGFGADVQARDIAGRTVLHHGIQGAALASMMGSSVPDEDYLACLRFLLAEIPIDFPDLSGASALTMAASFGYYSGTKLLLELKADIQHSDQLGMTALHRAAQGTSLEVVSLLLDHGASMNAQNTMGETPLMVAMRQSQMEVARLLLTRGAEVNIADKKGETPLLLASKSSTDELFLQLLECGADINAQNHEKETPLNRIILSGNEMRWLSFIDRPGLLVEPTENLEFYETPMQCVAHTYRLDWIQKLRSLGAKLSTQGHLGTALHTAAALDNSEMVKALVREGAFVNAQNREGQTPLMLAVQKRAFGAAQILLFEKFADPNIADSAGRSPLIVALQEQYPVMFPLLMQSPRINLNANLPNGDGPIHILVRKKMLTDLKDFLSRGANPNLAGAMKRTPLHLAVIEGSLEMVQALKGYHANPQLQDEAGKTPLDLAHDAQRADIVEALEQ